MQQLADIENEEIGPWQLVRDFFLNRVKWRTRISRSEFVTYNDILGKHSAFYRGLSPDMKAKTMNRVVAFAANKKFIGHGLNVTTEMKVIIAFAAVKLTFGFKKFSIPLLHTIHIATSAFYTPLIKSLTKGLTSENGTMYLAWDSVKAGIEDETDGLHLAVHEMAHALKIDTIKGSPAKERFAFYLNTWLKVAKVQKNKADNTFIREYGKSNMHEFFAVCMENFVERPEEFYKEEPLLFAHTCYLLNQFPLEPKSRELTPAAVHSLEKHTGAMFPDASDKDYTHHSWHWSLTVLMLSVIFSPFCIGFLTYQVIMPVDGWGYYFISCLIATAIFYRPVVGYKAITGMQFIAFVLAGGGPMLYSGALIVDAVLPIQRWEETARVLDARSDLHANLTYVTLEQGELAYWEQTTIRPIAFMQQFRENPNMLMHAKFGIGVLGITRIRDTWVEFGPKPPEAILEQDEPSNSQ